jgi:hypothetical protein
MQVHWIAYRCWNIDHRPRDDPRGDVGVSGAVRGTAGYGKDSSTVVGIEDSLFCYHKECKHQASRVACSVRVHCANIFRMGSGNSSFAKKSCARAMAFRAKIVSLYEGSTPRNLHIAQRKFFRSLGYCRCDSKDREFTDSEIKGSHEERMLKGILHFCNLTQHISSYLPLKRP